MVHRPIQEVEVSSLLQLKVQPHCLAQTKAGQILAASHQAQMADQFGLQKYRIQYLFIRCVAAV